jgi:GntR family transcriptional regulator / MocR family aminotransferase
MSFERLLVGSQSLENQRAGLVLGFAAVPEVQIGEALDRLAVAWHF